MAKVRISTTVDRDLLTLARSVHGGSTDASMLEAALEALVSLHQDAEIDAAYARAYADQPVAEPDAWGDPVALADGARRT